MVAALGLADFMGVNVPLNIPGASKWKRYAQHEAECSKSDIPHVTVRDVLRKGKLAPLTKEMVLTVCD